MRAVVHFLSRSRLLWVALWMVAAVVVLVALAWPGQAEAWIFLREAEVPLWAILASYVMTWVGNATFWVCVGLAGAVGWAAFDVIEDREAKYVRAEKAEAANRMNRVLS